MVRQDILEGLRRATAKGNTLQQAMMSFYYAGYSKEEIEDAARVFVQQNQSNVSSQPSQIQQNSPITQTSQVSSKQQPAYSSAQQTPPQNYVHQQTYVPQTKQIVSNYSSTTKKHTGLIIFLIIILVLLIGGLIGTIFFKEQITTFFTNRLG